MKGSRSKAISALLFAAHRDANGVTAVEFAMVAPLLVALFICMFDLGMGVYTDTQLSAAAQYGAGYAVQNGFNGAGIMGGIQNSTALKGIVVTSTQFCGCPSNSGVTTTSCSATCSDGLAAGTFAQINVAKDYSTIFAYPGLPSVFHLTETSTVRLQ